MPPLRLVPVHLLLACLVLACGPAAAQPVLTADTALVRAYLPPLVDAAARGRGASAFELQFFGPMPEAARADVETAAAIWGQHLESAVPIRVRVEWEALEGRTLGQARPLTVHADRSAFPLSGTWYPGPLAEALAGTSLPDNPYDIEATFNSAFEAWHFGTTPAPDDRYSFVTVVLHELGHGLGILGTFDVAAADDPAGCEAPAGQGCWGIGPPRRPIVFDRFAVDGQGTPLLNTLRYPNPSVALGAALQSQAVRFEGPVTAAALGGVPVDLHAPENFEPGSSFSHLDEEAFPPGTPNALMTPNIGRAETLLRIGPAACAMLADMGWRLATGCLNELDAPALALADIAATASRGVVEVTARVEGAFGEGFVIERQFFGTAGEGFVVLDTAYASAGVPVVIRDTPPGPGRYAYRLRPVLPVADLASFARTADVTVFSGSGPSLAVYPNPMRGAAVASVVLPAGRAGDDVTAEVFDRLGRRVAVLAPVEEDGRVRFALDPRRWASGVYIVQARGRDFQRSVRFAVVR